MLQREMDSKEFDELLGLKHSPKKRNTLFKLPAEDGKIFSNYFTHVIVDEHQERVIKPMRYRVRPNGSKEEVPNKFNVFNARIDSLEIRQTWKPLFMRNHGIVPFTNFYEWVESPFKEDNKKSKLITFYPENRDIMWAPCLWDEWISKDGNIHFKSFAIITDEPPKEILSMGHDRCPIFLDQNQIDKWLNPQKHSKDEMYNILTKKEKVFFKHDWVY